MRVRIYENGGYGPEIIIFPGGNMTGYLTLYGDPQTSLEAASKQYVDGVITNLNANNITSGTLSVARFPAFTGDINKAAGSSNINLVNSGVTAGTYTKVTVNSKGLITSGTNLIESDIPNLSWNKITTGKPTTLTGYGITDGIKITGDSLNGFLVYNGSITNNLQAVTKQYVDNALSSFSGYSVGDIIRRPNSTTPVGFLRCNGAWVSKTTYANLYGVIGDTYSSDEYGLQLGSGKPWKQQYAINTEQSGDITGWTTGTPLPGRLAYSQAIVTKNRVYLFGGDIRLDGTVSTVYTAPINTDGTLGAWTTDTSLPVPLVYSQAIVTKNRVYLLGGRSGRSPISTTYTAPINTDGTLGAWTTGTSLPILLAWSHAIVTKNRVYLLGGWKATYVIYNGNSVPINEIITTVYTAPINTDGTLGTWDTAGSLPGPLYGSQAVVTKNRVYLLGGHNGNNITYYVYTAPINADGTLGTWTTDTSLPNELTSSQAIVTKNRVYLLGGRNIYGGASIVFTAPINTDGTLGAWTTGTPLPGPISSSQAIVTKNRVYLLGGLGETDNFLSTVYTAPILGGLNDYSPYYDGTIILTDPNNFRLPDLTPYDYSDYISFIKY